MKKVLIVGVGPRKKEFNEFNNEFKELKRSLQALDNKGLRMKKDFKIQSQTLNEIEEKIIESHGKWFVKLFSTKGIDFTKLKRFKDDLSTSPKVDELIQSEIDELSEALSSYEKEYQKLLKQRQALITEMNSWLKKSKIYPKYKLNDSKHATSTKATLNNIRQKCTFMQNEHTNILELIREIGKTPLMDKIQLLEQIITWGEDFNAHTKDVEVFEELDSKFDKIIATLDAINDIESWKEWLLEKIQERNISGIYNMRFSDSDIESFITVGTGPILKQLEFRLTKMIIKKEAHQEIENEFSKLDLSLLNTTKHDFSKKIRKSFSPSKISGGYDEMILQTNELKDKIEAKLDEMNARLDQNIAASTKRHFKRERFNMLIVSSIDRKDKDFIKEKKNDWPRYPNYHIITDNISNSTKKHEVIDSLVKLPIRPELAVKCIENGLSPDHAKILEHIDEDGELIEIHKKGVAVELILSLKDEADKDWYDALLQDSEFHEQITEIKSKRFHLGLWEKLKNGIIEVWQYHVIAGTEFDDEQLDDMCEAEDVWGDAEEFYAPNNNLESQFKTLKSVHEPKDPGSDGKRSIISPDDIFDNVTEVTKCERYSKREIKFTKVKDSKPDPFKIF